MDEKQFYIPQYLDEPTRFLLWTMDETLAFFIPLFISLMMNHTGLGLGVGLVGLIGLKKFKSKIGVAYKRWLYWYVPAKALRMQGTPSSVIREYLG